MYSFKELIKKKNKNKILFTPGPSSLSEANLINLNPPFGRGDKYYAKTEKIVLSKIKKISGHKKIIATQGSGSTVLEMVSLNFLKGNVLIISTGYYSDRLYNLAIFAKKTHNNIKTVKKIDWKNLNQIKTKFDWIWACYTETSRGLKMSMDELKKLSRRTKSNLAIDATASFGLEKDHKYADVVSFSSCKGLFGLTGASFVAFNNFPSNKINQFNLNIENHLNKKMTGPYHAICSLNEVLPSYNDFKYAVVVNKKYFLKKMNNYLLYPNESQPNLCTVINKKICNKNKNIILYQSRADIKGSIVCHLGEVHLKRKALGKIIDSIKLCS